MSNNQNLPLTFRSHEVQQIIDTVRAGESCAVVGVGSTGKSNLLRFLAEPRIQDHYLKNDSYPHLFVLVDGDDLVGFDEGNFYELLLNRLARAAMEQTAPAPNRGGWLIFLKTLDHMLGISKTTGGTRRLLGEAVASLRSQHYHLTFLFDDFDEAFKKCDPAIFAGLRALRNEHKYHLVYVVAGRRPMTCLREAASKFETFSELFSQHTFPLGPYNREDASFMLKRLADRLHYSLSNDAMERLISATGGHAGLLRAAFWAAKDALPLHWAALLRLLRKDQGIQEDCQKILESLEESERETLEGIVRGRREPRRAIDSLLSKGLILQPSSLHYELFSPVLKEFILAHPSPRIPPDDLMLGEWGGV